MPLDLLLPDLLLPQDALESRALRLPYLEKWLARADLETEAYAGRDAWLAAAFEVPSPLAHAAICLAGEGEKPAGAWMHADPVHLRVDRDGLKLHDASALDLGEEEAQALVSALQAHFGRDGLRFHATAPLRWYVALPESELPATTPLDRALGRDVFELLPRSRGAFDWRTALTEAQMVLAGHPANAAREAAGKPPVNSVWFWGEGVLPTEARRVYAAVDAADVFTRGLAAISSRAAGDSRLVVLDALTGPLRRGDNASWRAAAEEIDRRVFGNLAEDISRFGRVRIVLPAESSTLVATLTAASRWRWFRPRKPLAAHA